jgi:cytidyltransferase-like protein
MSSVGVYVGLFDPVHAGHVAFALQALQEAHLETVCLLPERMPAHKRPVEHYGHRVAMLRRALKPHEQLAVVETADKYFRPHQTIPRLQATLGQDQFTFLCSIRSFLRMLAADTSSTLQHHAFVVSVADPSELKVAAAAIEQYSLPPKHVTFVDSLRPDVATEYVQMALSRNKNAPGLLASVARYAKSEWLYAQLPKS